MFGSLGPIGRGSHVEIYVVEKGSRYVDVQHSDSTRSAKGWQQVRAQFETRLYSAHSITTVTRIVT